MPVLHHKFIQQVLHMNTFKVVTIAAFLFGSMQASAQLEWPAITQQNKPWTRWWWQGSAVNKSDLTWNMESYRDAGLGGLEITPIYGVKGAESQFIPFLTPKWMDMLQHTLQEGKRLNLGIDVANATGWPFGGPWITDADASKEMFWKKYELKGGEQLKEAVVFIQEPMVRAEGKAPAIGSIKQPLSSNANLQQLALDQIRFEKRLPLTILMAYNSQGQALNITDKVKADGTLQWTAPAGSQWRLYALFLGDHGKMVERAAPGGEGLVIDHFSKTALSHYLGKFDEAFNGRSVNGIRAFFNDSYEVDDARGQSNFTPQFFTAFQQRRGYDLRNYLPALFGEGDKETASRVLTDYRETIGDLLLENFTRLWHEWGKGKGALIRNQSHGSPANILDLYAAIDIPETEGDDILRFKFASSTAHVTGKPLTSSESATWLNDHFLSSLGNVKQVLDKFFLGGVNHVFYHGVNYSPKDAAWPGWMFYAAVHFQQTNPFWKHFAALNEYVARCQSFLQSGKPANDVLVYYPLFDSYADAGRALLKHYHGMKPEFTGTGFERASEEMLRKGFTFDFISDKQISAIQASGARLFTGGVGYKTLLLPDCRLISLATFQKLINMAKGGATIAVYKNMPAGVPGLGQLEARKNAFADLIGSLHFTTGARGVQTAQVGKGRFVLADDIAALLETAGVSREKMTDNGLQFIRRAEKDGYTYFISNLSDKTVSGQIPLAVKAASVIVYDAMRKQNGLLAVQRNQDGASQVYLQLNPGESYILKTSESVVKGEGWKWYKPAAAPVELKGEWTISFAEGGPALPAAIKTDKPGLWTDLGGEDAKAFSGIASYTTTFARPAGSCAMWQLCIGKVHESAEVYLNGKLSGTLLGPDYSLRIPATEFKVENRLEIKVANLMANRLMDMEKKGEPYKIFYNINFPAHDKENRGADGLFTTLNWKTKPSGIAGKVELLPLLEF